MIVAGNLVKHFPRTKPAARRIPAVRALFTHQRETIRAVDGVTLTIDEGEIVSYPGPTGAGKSPTIKTLTGILVPTGGTFEVAGLAPREYRERNAMNTGAVFGQRSQPWQALPLRIVVHDLQGRIARYPMGIFERPLRAFMTWIVPMAFMAWLPARVLLHRTAELPFPAWVAWLSPLIWLLLIAGAI